MMEESLSGCACAGVVVGVGAVHARSRITYRTTFCIRYVCVGALAQTGRHARGELHQVQAIQSMGGARDRLARLEP